jgi:hypothetical protein
MIYCSFFHPSRLTGCAIIGGDPPRASPVFSKINESSEAQGIMLLTKFPGYGMCLCQNAFSLYSFK